MNTEKVRILLVDDSASMREMVGFTLRNAGFEVTEAEDGVIAYDIALKDTLDLVATDINMPNMDGFTLTRKLRQLQNYKFVPILVISTETSAEKKKEGKDAGATGWIEKPFDPDHLLYAVNRVLK